jgi:hypothetical protein
LNMPSSRVRSAGKYSRKKAKSDRQDIEFSFAVPRFWWICSHPWLNSSLEVDAGLLWRQGNQLFFFLLQVNDCYFAT